MLPSFVVAALAALAPVQDAPPAAAVPVAPDASALFQLVPDDAWFVAELASPAQLHDATRDNAWIRWLFADRELDGFRLRGGFGGLALEEFGLPAGAAERLATALTARASELDDRPAIARRVAEAANCLALFDGAVLVHAAPGLGAGDVFVAATRVPVGGRIAVERLAKILEMELAWTTKGRFEVATIGAGALQVACRDDLVLLASSDAKGPTTAALLAAVRRVDGGDPSGPWRADYDALRATLPAGASCVGGFLVGGAMEELVDEMALDPSVPPALVEDLALEEIGWVGFGLGMGAGANAALHLGVEMPDFGLVADVFDAFGIDPAAGLAQRMPADAIGVQLGGFDLAAVRVVVSDALMAYGLAGDLYAALAVDEATEDLGFDPYALALEQFTGQLLTYTSGDPGRRERAMEMMLEVPGESPFDLFGVGGTTMFEVRDGDQVRRLVEGTLDSVERDMGMALVERRTVDELSVYDLSQLLQVPIWLGVASDAVLIGTELETVVEDGRRRDAAGFERVAELLDLATVGEGDARALDLPAGAMSLQFESARTLIEFFRAGMASEAGFEVEVDFGALSEARMHASTVARPGFMGVSMVLR